LDILLCDIDIMKVLPDLSQHFNRDTFESIRANYNNRYSLTSKQFKEILEKAKMRSYPESAWVRTILEVVKVGQLDFALLSRILKKFIMRPTTTHTQAPRLLQIITNSIKDIKMVESILSVIEMARINSKQNYSKIQGNPFGLENHLTINTWFEADPLKRLEAR
jgi:hypothetical protein